MTMLETYILEWPARAVISWIWPSLPETPDMPHPLHSYRVPHKGLGILVENKLSTEPTFQRLYHPGSSSSNLVLAAFKPDRRSRCWSRASALMILDNRHCDVDGAVFVDYLPNTPLASLCGFLSHEVDTMEAYYKDVDTLFDFEEDNYHRFFLENQILIRDDPSFVGCRCGECPHLWEQC